MKNKITVTELAVNYLMEVFWLSRDDAHKVWSYHCRNYPYAYNARDEDVLKTKILGKKHLTLVNLSAHEWLKENKPNHPFIEKFEKWRRGKKDEERHENKE